MKKILSVVLVVTAIIFSAFTQPTSVTPVNGELWFQLKAGGDANVAEDYQMFGNGSTAPSCTGSNVCAKLAVPDPQNEEIPDLETTISVKYRTTP